MKQHKDCPQWLREVCEETYLGDVDGMRYGLRDESPEDLKLLDNCLQCGVHRYWERSVKRMNKALDDQLCEELNF